MVEDDLALSDRDEGEDGRDEFGGGTVAADLATTPDMGESVVRPSPLGSPLLLSPFPSAPSAISTSPFSAPPPPFAALLGVLALFRSF